MKNLATDSKNWEQCLKALKNFWLLSPKNGQGMHGRILMLLLSVVRTWGREPPVPRQPLTPNFMPDWSCRTRCCGPQSDVAGMLVCFESLLTLLSFYSIQGEPGTCYKELFRPYLKMCQCCGWIVIEDKGLRQKTQALSLFHCVFFSLAELKFCE